MPTRFFGTFPSDRRPASPPTILPPLILRHHTCLTQEIQVELVVRIPLPPINSYIPNYQNAGYRGSPYVEAVPIDASNDCANF
jgi:hypothetical protein